MSDLISIIVPVYNTGKYLNNCVHSIINQDYSNLEIILIDDGSTDAQTIQLCDELAKEFSIVSSYHKPNGGSASARNFGINLAKGKYIGFVDSDDEIEPAMFSILYQAIKTDDVKVSICGISTEENGNIELDYRSLQTGVYDNHELMHYFLLGLWHSACTCLYDKTLFNDVLFPEGEVNEDYILNYHIFKNLDKVSFINEPFYHYVRRGGSNTSAPKTLKFLDWIKHTKLVLDELRERPSLQMESEHQYLYSNIILGNSALLTYNRIKSSDSKELFKIVSNNLSQEKEMLRRNKFLSKKNRIMGLMMAYCPSLYKYCVLGALKIKK